MWVPAEFIFGAGKTRGKYGTRGVKYCLAESSRAYRDECVHSRYYYK